MDDDDVTGATCAEWNDDEMVDVLHALGAKINEEC